jgi:hypothetical protein
MRVEARHRRVVRSIETELNLIAMPHIQNQKTSEMITRTGLRVNRLARSIGVVALNQKNPKAPAVTREAEEDWGR